MSGFDCGKLQSAVDIENMNKNSEGRFRVYLCVGLVWRMEWEEKNLRGDNGERLEDPSI